MVCVILYAILLATDIVPLIKKKEKKALYISIPVYAVTFAVNVLIGLRVHIISLGELTDRIMSWF